MTFRRKSNKQARKIMRASSVVAETRGAKVVSNQMLVSRVPKMPTKGHICIIRSVGGIGDVLMMTPGIRALKEQNPNLEITVAVDMHTTWDKSYREMLKNAPFIDHLIDARYVNRNKFTKVVDISSVCIAFEKKELRVNNRIDLFARALGVRNLKNKVPFYRVETDEKIWARRFFDDSFGDKKVIGVVTASNDSKRTWKKKHLMTFLNKLTKLKNAEVLLFDFNRVLSQKQREQYVDAQGTTVRQMAALIERCSVLVTPDTGPMHIAGALQVPSVCLFGSIPPQARINHYDTHEAVVSEEVDCLGCWYSACPINDKCMETIYPERVYKKVLHKLEENSKSVDFHSVLNPVDGYGSSAEQMALSLKKHRAVSFLPTEIKPDWERFAQQGTREIVSLRKRSKNLLSYYSPNKEHVPWSGGYHKRVIYTTFESTKVPKRWIPHINTYDKLIVSCVGMAEAFKKCGVEIPIDIVPLGANKDLWQYKRRDVKGKIRFLVFANADWMNPRKNYDAAFRAFRRAFGNRSDVELVVKLSHGDVPKHVQNCSNVKVIVDKYTTQQLKKLLYSCNALVVPTRGEGFGLPAREAMCTGMPVVAASFMGMEPIMELPFNYKVDHTLATANYGIRNDLIKHNYGSDDFGVWAEPSVDSMAEQMLKLVEEKDSLNEKGLLCHEWILENETYEICAKKLDKALK